jgi:hypothetical protein
MGDEGGGGGGGGGEEEEEEERFFRVLNITIIRSKCFFIIIWRVRTQEQNRSTSMPVK